MKKIIALTLFLLISVSQVFAASKSKVSINGTGVKPNFVLIYAKWAPDFGVHQANLKAVRSKYSSDATFTEIDISDPMSSAAADFNSKYIIYTNVPYVIMLKGGSCIYRYIPNDCSKSQSCLESRIKTYLKK